MLAEEEESVVVIDDRQFEDKIARRSLSKSLAQVAQNRVHKIAGKRGQDYIPRKFPAVRSEYDAVPGLLLRWRFKSCHDSLCVLNVSGCLLAPSRQVN